VLIIDTTYENLQEANIEQIFFMVPMEGRNDNFDMIAITPGGAVYRVSQPTMPDGFAARFPNATEVEAFTLT
jgi:hypothetical protein